MHRAVGVESAGEDPDQTDPADVRVAGRLDDLGHQRSVGVAGQRVGRAAGRGEDLRAGVFGRRREPPHDHVEQLGAADPRRGADREHREERAACDRPLEIGDEQGFVHGLAAEITVHQAVVLGLLDDALDQGGALLGLDLGVRRGRGAGQGDAGLRVAVMVVVELVEQADQSGDLVALGHRQEQREDLVAERILRLGEDAGVVGAGVVELRDHHRPGHPHVGALVPEPNGRVVDPLVGRDHEQGAVRRPQPGPQLTDEVGVSGSVDQVDLGAGVHQRRHGERHGTPMCLLGLLVVGDRGALGDRAGAVDRPTHHQQRLEECCLSRRARPDQDDVANPVGPGRLEVLVGAALPCPFVSHEPNQPRSGPPHKSRSGPKDTRV